MPSGYLTFQGSHHRSRFAQACKLDGGGGEPRIRTA